jgi:uncharacterized membrane protein YccC
MRHVERLTWADLAQALELAIACLVSFVIMTSVLNPFFDRSSDLLGGMWAVVATVFVFRPSLPLTLSAVRGRMTATCVAFALCLVYLWILPFSPIGMAALIGIGAAVVTLMGRPDDIVTAGITIAVVMVVAGLSPEDARYQPVLRLLDTAVGVGVGIAAVGIGSMSIHPPWRASR